jgi:nicotinate-nucleotide adenylyltransferase
VKLAILGGSFNPIHLGHIFLAGTVLSTLHYDRVVMVPAFRSPFKLNQTDSQASSSDRLEMLAASVAGDSCIAVDDCEIRREGVSYTIDTLQDIIMRYRPDGKPALIIGDDLASDFNKWHESEKIPELADVIIGRRKNKFKNRYRFPHIFLNNEIMRISSHDIRERIGKGLNWKYLVPSQVVTIIEDRRLYKLSGNQQEIELSLIKKVENTARETLSVERFLHSRNTALLAVDLCRRFGLDTSKGYLAGIAHDLAKQLDNKTMIKTVKRDGRENSILEEKFPNILHGRAAVVLLRERFDISNKDVLEAVALHTSGSADMSALAKIIYIADKTEVSRNIEPALREMLDSENDLDKILYAVVIRTIAKLQAKDKALSEETVDLFNKLKGIYHL